jgi:hypothetical protein
MMESRIRPLGDAWSVGESLDDLRKEDSIRNGETINCPSRILSSSDGESKDRHVIAGANVRQEGEEVRCWFVERGMMAE